MTSSVENFSSIFTLENPELKVIEVSDLTAIQKVVSNWFEIAKRRYNTAKLFNRDLCNEVMLERLKDSKLITEGMKNRLIQILGEKIQDKKTVFACVDQNSKYQALALIDCATNKISYLATHPNNIPTRLSKERVRGAGTKIIQHLAQIALKTGNDIRVFVLYGTEDFYKKFEFVEDASSQDHILTAAKIKELVAKKTAPFDQLKLEE